MINNDTRMKYAKEQIKRLEAYYNCGEVNSMKLFKLLDRKVYLIDRLIRIEQQEINKCKCMKFDEFVLHVDKTVIIEHTIMLFIVFKLIHGVSVELNELTPLLGNVDMLHIIKISQLMPLVDCEFVFQKKDKFIINSAGVYIGKASTLALLANSIRFSGERLLESMSVFKILIEDFHVGNLCTYNKSYTRSEVIALCNSSKIQNRTILFNSLSGLTQFDVIEWGTDERIIHSEELGLTIKHYIHNNSNSSVIEVVEYE